MEPMEAMDPLEDITPANELTAVQAVSTSIDNTTFPSPQIDDYPPEEFPMNKFGASDLLHSILNQMEKLTTRLCEL
jgi:hypothetical protein